MQAEMKDGVVGRAQMGLSLEGLPGTHVGGSKERQRLLVEAKRGGDPRRVSFESMDREGPVGETGPGGDTLGTTEIEHRASIEFGQEHLQAMEPVRDRPFAKEPQLRGHGVVTPAIILNEDPHRLGVGLPIEGGDVSSSASDHRADLVGLITKPGERIQPGLDRFLGDDERGVLVSGQRRCPRRRARHGNLRRHRLGDDVGPSRMGLRGEDDIETSVEARELPVAELARVLGLGDRVLWPRPHQSKRPSS